MTLKVRILHILTTFTQVTARLKNFLVGWLLVLRLKKGLVECATVCVKSWVILTDFKSNVGTSLVRIESEFLWNYDAVPLCTVCFLYLNYSFHFLNDFWRKNENLGKIRAYFEKCLAISYQPSVLLSGILYLLPC